MLYRQNAMHKYHMNCNQILVVIKRLIFRRFQASSFLTPWHFISNMAFLIWRWMHIPHNILYLKVSYTSKNAIPNIYSILIEASYYPLALFFCSILQLDLCGAARMSKQIQLGQCFSFCLETGAKPFFPHSSVTWFHVNINQIEDIHIKFSLKV